MKPLRPLPPPPPIGNTKIFQQGPGTELKKLIGRLGIGQGPCKCAQRALLMNMQGPDWCEKNVNKIVEWMREEAKKRKLPFIEIVAKLLIKRAIKIARHKGAKSCLHPSGLTGSLPYLPD